MSHSADEISKAEVEINTIGKSFKKRKSIPVAKTPLVKIFPPTPVQNQKKLHVAEFPEGI